MFRGCRGVRLNPLQVLGVLPGAACPYGVKRRLLIFGGRVSRSLRWLRPLALSRVRERVAKHALSLSKGPGEGVTTVTHQV